MALFTRGRNTMLDSADTQEHNAAPKLAYLLFEHTDCAKNERYDVYANDQFDVGRKDIEYMWGETDLTISTHHLRFWCVTYESDLEEKVSPMVYVRVLSSNSVRFTPVWQSESDHSSTTCVLAKTDSGTLLNHGDLLHLTNKVSIRFMTRQTYAAQSGAFTAQQVAELEHFDHQYLVTNRKLGIGGSGSVFVAVKLSTRVQFACKIVKASILREFEGTGTNSSSYTLPEGQETASRDSRDRSREYTVLKNLSHPNIITLEKVMCAADHIYIFQELITGGDLCSYMDLKGPLPEAESAVIARQVVKAVDYLHDNGVVHRDIKPENILMTSWREGARIVLTDFGEARTFEETKADIMQSAVSRMTSMVGTHGYMAPDVLNMERIELRNKGYSKVVDIWSIGCMTASLLTNQAIFPDEGAAAKDKALRAFLHSLPASERWSLRFMDESTAWQSVGRKAKSFIRGCLRLYEDKRLTAKQALQHEWFTNKHYAKDIEDAYQRAIQDWTPRDHAGDLVELIDTSGGMEEADLVALDVTPQKEPIKSQYFTQPPPYPVLPESLGPPPSLSHGTAATSIQDSLGVQSIPMVHVEYADAGITENGLDPVWVKRARNGRHLQPGSSSWTAGLFSSDNFRNSGMDYSHRSSIHHRL